MKKMIKWCFAAFVAAAIIIPAAAQNKPTRKIATVVKYLDRGGESLVSLEYLDAGTVIRSIRDITFNLLESHGKQFFARRAEGRPGEPSPADTVMATVKDILDQSGLQDICGYGSSLVKNGDTYTLKNLLAIDEKQRETNPLINLLDSNTAEEMIKFKTTKDIIAISVNFKGETIWNLVDHNVKKYVTREYERHDYDRFLREVQEVTGMEASQLFSSVQGVGFFVKAGQSNRNVGNHSESSPLKGFKKSDRPRAVRELSGGSVGRPGSGRHGINRGIMKDPAFPSFTILFDMKDKSVCNKLLAHLSIRDEEFLHGRRIIPAREFGGRIAIGMTGKYGYITNDLQDLNDRLARRSASADKKDGKKAAWCHIAPGAGKELLQFLTNHRMIENQEQQEIAESAIEIMGLNTSTSITLSLVPEGVFSVCKTNSDVLAFYFGTPRIQGIINGLIGIVGGQIF